MEYTLQRMMGTNNYVTNSITLFSVLTNRRLHQEQQFYPMKVNYTEEKKKSFNTIWFLLKVFFSILC